MGPWVWDIPPFWGCWLYTPFYVFNLARSLPSWLQNALPENRLIFCSKSISAKGLTSSAPLPLAKARDLTPCFSSLPPLLVRSGFFPALLLLYKMTSLALPDALAIWRLRSELKPHHRDGLLASADSDYHVVLVSLRALLNRAGLGAHFDAQGDVADL